jgi:signal transduction histidine kinase
MSGVSGQGLGVDAVPFRGPPGSLGCSPDADGAALGAAVLAEVVTNIDDGIGLLDGEGRWVYANPATCRMLGQSFERLAGRDFQEILADSPSACREWLDQPDEPFAFSRSDAAGVVREIACSTFALATPGRPDRVVMLKDLTGPRTEARTAAALAQTAAQLAGAGTTPEILVGLARHGVEGTRALAIGTIVVGDDRKLIATGGYGYPAQEASREAWTAAAVTVDDLPGAEALLDGQTVVSSDARARWEASPVLAPFAATLTALDWQAAVYVPLTWEGSLLGVFGAYLPSDVAAPTDDELDFYTALADQSAVAVINARLAASVERTRLARELHDSVSQALFSMTLHARAAQLSMAKAGLDQDTPVGRSVTQLAELTRGALAEMRALIFELRPGALAEEGLVAALQKQGAALSAREQVAITVEGPEPRLELSGGVEEHLYRIASEALHNVVKHAGADHASVRVSVETASLKMVVGDDGAGFDPELVYAGHLGLATMAERAAVIGADLTVVSAPADGTTVTVTLPYVPVHRGAIPDVH